MTTEDKVYLTPAALQEAAVELWGAEKWRTAFSENTGISYSQLHRYMTVYNGQRIPQTLAMVMHLLMTLKVNDIDLTPLPTYPASDLKPIKFEWVKKPKPDRLVNDAPEEDFFGTGDPEPETAAPEIKTQEPPASAPEPVKPSRKRAMAGPDLSQTGPEKVPTEKRKPSLAKASRMLGTLMETPKKRPAKKTKA